MLRITATMQTDYNGWTVDTAPDQEPLGERLMDMLPDITSDCYDEDGNLTCKPSKYETQIKQTIHSLINQPCYLIIEYDEFSS